jgi:hypothetical protein
MIIHQFLDRLDKRTYDLKLARQITIQQAPQIRLIQNTNQALAEKIQASNQYSDSFMEKPSGDRIGHSYAKRMLLQHSAKFQKQPMIC